MTTLYRPVKIESATQAGDLPPGTIATLYGAYPCWKHARQEWMTVGSPGRWAHADMIGWTALVPVEAREEQTWISSNLAGPMHVGFGAAFDTPHSRLVTPWSPLR